MNIEEIKARYAIMNDAASDKKKRYEVHFQAQDAKGNIFNLVKEAVCKPGELKSILKKFESEQKAKGNKIISELYRKSFAADAVSVNDMPFWEIKRNYESTKNGSNYPAIKRKNDTEYQKAVKEIKLAKQMKQADLDLAKSISMSKEHLNLKPVESALNGISNARDKLKAMVQKIQQKYSVNVSEAAVDSVSVNDKYDLGLNVNKNVPNAPVKVLTVTTKKEQDGVSGTVKFSKGGKNYAERFMVYSSGNWDIKPISNPGMNYSASDREALMNAVRNKLSALGIKAK